MGWYQEEKVGAESSLEVVKLSNSNIQLQLEYNNMKITLAPEAAERVAFEILKLVRDKV